MGCPPDAREEQQGRQSILEDQVPSRLADLTTDQTEVREGLENQ
jgi:hypothetical protein